MGACTSSAVCRSGNVHASQAAAHSIAQLTELAEEAESDLPSRIAEDGRLLADFALHLHSKRKVALLLDLWALELAAGADWRHAPETAESDEEVACVRNAHCGGLALGKGVLERCTELVESLKDSWEDYKDSENGLGNFADTDEWAQHDFPSEAIVQSVNTSEASCQVKEDHSNYPFAIAAMVGIHVSIVCSDLVAGWAAEAAGGQSRCAEEFQQRFPMLSYEACLQHAVRTFPVPACGSAYSPATCLPETFHIEEFAPRLFSRVRQCCGISSASFFDSVCRTDFDFISFGTNSKSGEIFFFTHDQKYLLKTTTEIEAETLVSMLQRYLERLESEPRSLLGRYLGLYRVTLKDEAPLLFFVMRAVTSHKLSISHSYDLKGSSRNRRSKPGDSVGKDLNFQEEMGSSLDLPSSVGKEVAEVHEGDVELLQSFRIMDFSLFVQIHDKTGEYFKRKQEELADEAVEANGCFIKKRKTRGVVMEGQSSTVAASEAAEMTDRDCDVVLQQGHPSSPGAGACYWSRMSAVMKLLQTCNSAQQAFSTGGTSQASAGGWKPDDGSILRKDGSMTYTMGLIDMLVPFTVYPQMQYVGMEVVTCGRGTQSSRVPPDYYCERQIEKVHSLCSQESPYED